MVGSLVARGVTFLDMPLVTRETVKGVQVRQRAKPGCSAKQLHRPRAVMAARSFRRGRVGVAHDTISSSPLHVVRVHYQRVAGSLILGNASSRGAREPGGQKTRLSPTCARVISGHDRSRRTIRSANYSRSPTGERQGQHRHQKFPHSHLRCIRVNVPRLGVGEGDRDHRFVDCRLSRTLVCNLCDSGHLQRWKTWPADPRLTHCAGVCISWAEEVSFDRGAS